MDVIKRWFIGDMGIPGDYSYQAIHFIPLAIVIVLVAICAILGASKRISDKDKRKILIGIAVFQLVFEVFWRIIYITVKQSQWVDLYPMYPCNLNGILVPIAALINNKTMKKMFYLFGFIGGVLTFVMPDGIFSTSVFVFPILKSVMQHTGLLFIPVFEYAAKTYIPNIKDFFWTFLGTALHFINAEIIDLKVLGLEGDFMFYRSGLPFVIPGVSQYITLTVFGIIVVVLILLVSDVKVTKEVFNKLKSKRKKKA
ncbi:MAG: YwaF family protein [Clostridia bacterium]|nr:YwaF family protein [Clostridia bacterium]MBO7156550.1 YwaF family protein [Clostridia bacterium]